MGRAHGSKYSGDIAHYHPVLLYAEDIYPRDLADWYQGIRAYAPHDVAYPKILFGFPRKRWHYRSNSLPDSRGRAQRRE
jgi:hypothetical protein